MKEAEGRACGVSRVIKTNYDRVTVRKAWWKNEIIQGLHYKYLRVNNTVFKCNRRNSCFLTKNNEVVML